MSRTDLRFDVYSSTPRAGVLQAQGHFPPDVAQGLAKDLRKLTDSEKVSCDFVEIAHAAQQGMDIKMADYAACFDV